MKKLTEIQKTDKEITLKGFVQQIRKHGSITFIVLRTFKEVIQVVCTKEYEEAFELVKKLTLESVIEVKGCIKKEKQAPGGIELSLYSIRILSLADSTLAIPVIYEKGGSEPKQPKPSNHPSRRHGAAGYPWLCHLYPSGSHRTAS